MSTTSTSAQAQIVSAGQAMRATLTRPPRATPASTSDIKRKASGLAPSVSAASSANQGREPPCNAQTANSASESPSANGKAAVSMYVPQTTAKAAPASRALDPHSRASRTANASVPTTAVATASSLIPSSAASG